MRKRAEKALSVISGILIALFLMLATFSLAITIFYSAKGEDAVLFGCQYRIVLSGSMAPEIKEGDMVAVRVPKDDRQAFYDNLQIGDVLTFYYKNPSGGNKIVVTHQIIAIKKVSTGYEYTMKGTAVENDTQTITSASGDIIGKVVWHSGALGAFVQFIRSKAGIVVCMILPALAIAVFETVRIIRIVRESRKEKKEDGVSERDKDEEIEALRREIEQLKKGRDNGDE